MKTFEKWLSEELDGLNLGGVTEHEEGLLRTGWEECLKANNEPVADVLCSDGLSGIDRAIELRRELFDIANSYAGEETGKAAVMLHQACNYILRAEEYLK